MKTFNLICGLNNATDEICLVTNNDDEPDMFVQLPDGTERAIVDYIIKPGVDIPNERQRIVLLLKSE